MNRERRDYAMLMSAGLGGIIVDDLKKTWSQQALNRW